MASQRNKGRPVQIVRLEGGTGCRLEENVLERILLDDNVKNLPVVIVSIAGMFRKGKSFLLNFFLQYMQNRTKGDWISRPDAHIHGFAWRGGSETETTGIWIWDEVFVVPTSNGGKVALLFLDTQGTFDTKTTVNNCATIFSFSMMASSVQIYNISQNIGEDHLQQLHLFTEYGKLALQATGEIPFQKLLFLVRDWQYEYERAFGYEGGNGLLHQRLDVSGNRDPQLRTIREDLRSCFSELSCFLMPHPGKKVASGKDKAACLSDIDEDFKKQLRVLVPSLLHPNELVVKKINGSVITCREMLRHFGMFAQMFNGGELPDPRSMFEAGVEAQNLSAVDKAIGSYRNDMENLFHGEKPYIDDATLRKEHQRWRDEAVNVFDSTRKLGGESRSRPYKQRLIKMIDGEFESFSKRNVAERIKAEEKKIKDDAHSEAKKILEDAEARAENIMRAALVTQFALAAQGMSPGVFSTAARAAAFASAAYGFTEIFRGMPKEKTSSDKDKKKE